MKIINRTYHTETILSFFIILVSLLLLISCTRKLSFQVSPVVPAAQGVIKVKKDKNNNYNIDLNTSRLADPSRLTPPRQMYIVWMETEQNGTKNIGQLKTSSGLFSSNLKSNLETVTPYKPTRFFVTAEDDARLQYPRGVMVLNTGGF